MTTDREKYVTPQEAFTADKVMGIIIKAFEQFQYERSTGMTRPFTNSPPLPPSCTYIKRWDTVQKMRYIFDRLRKALAEHKDALEEEVSDAEVLRAIVIRTRHEL